MSEVQAMADDLASSKYTGRDPVRSGELTMAEIEKGQADPAYSLKMHKAPVTVSRTTSPTELQTGVIAVTIEFVTRCHRLAVPTLNQIATGWPAYSPP